MSKQPSGKRRPQARKGRTAVAAKSARKQTDRTAWIIAGAIIVVGVALVIAFAGNAKKKNDAISGDKAAPAALVSKVTGVKDTVITQVGQGSTIGLPKKIGDKPLVTKDGKPRVVYLGAEYCPYCATERWAMVQALSRFGKFSNLRITTSAAKNQVGSPEVFPNTATFSFHGSKYSSPYIQFEPVEQKTNDYKDLETPTSEQEKLAQKYDSPPYVDQQSAGAIPFIDFANQYLISGASYDAGVLAGKTHAEIAAAMNDPSSDIAKGAIGTANAITATICKITGDKNTKVCSDSAVKSIEGQL